MEVGCVKCQPSVDKSLDAAKTCILKQALQAILDAYLRKELAAWAKRFPDEFYEQMFRLRGWQWKGMKVNRPQIVGRYTNDLVYERLEPGILNELQTRNPKNQRGERDSKPRIEALVESLDRHLAGAERRGIDNDVAAEDRVDVADHAAQGDRLSRRFIRPKWQTSLVGLAGRSSRPARCGRLRPAHVVRGSRGSSTRRTRPGAPRRRSDARCPSRRPSRPSRRPVPTWAARRGSGRAACAGAVRRLGEPGLPREEARLPDDHRASCTPPRPGAAGAPHREATAMRDAARGASAGARSQKARSCRSSRKMYVSFVVRRSMASSHSSAARAPNCR